MTLAVGASLCISACSLGSDSSDTCGEPEPLGSVSQELRGARFGTYCQETFQNGWQDEQVRAWTRCAGFNNQLDDTDTRVFYYNLDGKKYYLEQNGDHQPNLDAPDDVDLLYIHTHGAAWSTTATYTMWNEDQRAFTSNMRLGDSASWGGGLAVFAGYVCNTLLIDSNWFARWRSPTFGGLKYVLGSWGALYNSYWTDEVGRDFAENLQYGDSFGVAWKDGVSDWYHDQDAASLVTGTGEWDCVVRRDFMDWQSYGQYPFHRDSTIKYHCWNHWEL